MVISFVFFFFPMLTTTLVLSEATLTTMPLRGLSARAVLGAAWTIPAKPKNDTRTKALAQRLKIRFILRLLKTTLCRPPAHDTADPRASHLYTFPQWSLLTCNGDTPAPHSDTLVSSARHVVFPMAEVAIPRGLFRAILHRIRQ